MRETTLMKPRFDNVAVSVVALVAAATALPGGRALAADWNNGDGSLKDVRGRPAAAVPAPMPIPDSVGTGWYIRGDIGAGRRGSKDVSESGMQFGQSGPNGQGGTDTMIPWAGYSNHTSPFGSSPSWFNNDNKTIFNYGGGVGYHWTKNFRTDVTLDRRNPDKYVGRGTYAYQYQTASNNPAPGCKTCITNTEVMGTVVDDTTIKSGALLLNGYYDIGTYRGFTPYIGGGLGVALLSVNRHVAVSEIGCQYDPAVPGQCASAADFNLSRGGSASGKTSQVAFAAAATAGISYSLTQNTALDVNYKYLFINGTDVTAGGSKVHIGDIGEHQLRTGLRWDIN
jgi:opacity protein-like surface antigen